jgi:Holliday junction DNA helicase RuvA
MIGRLTGKIVCCSPDQVLLDVAGVGYEVRIPLSTFYTLAAGGGGSISLHVHTHVREDALQLYGFASSDERRAFEQLISISGVGPRLALAFLSGIGTEELKAAVVRRDRERLQRIPGVGKKTADRVLLELRDKMGTDEIDGRPDDSPAGSAAVRGDAVSALVNLGYSRQVASRAVGKALDGDPAGNLESILKAALAGVVR